MNEYKGAVLVTGGTGNIGSGAVERFAKAGFKVYAADIKSELPDRLKGLDNFQYLEMDVTQEGSVKDGIEHIAGEYGSLNHLVTAHGGAPLFECQTPIWELSLEQWRESMDLNLTPVFLLTKYGVPLLADGVQEQGNRSSINLISSVNANQSFGLPIYSTAKAALEGYAMTNAHDLGLIKEINISNFVFGTTPNPKVIADNEKLGTAHIYPGRYKKMSATGEVGTAEAAADLVYAVATSPIATGQSLIFDMGMSIHRPGHGAASKEEE